MICKIGVVVLDMCGCLEETRSVFLPSLGLVHIFRFWKMVQVLFNEIEGDAYSAQIFLFHRKLKSILYFGTHFKRFLYFKRITFYMNNHIVFVCGIHIAYLNEGENTVPVEYSALP